MAVDWSLRHPPGWDVAFNGTDTETFGPITNSFTVALTELKITAKEDVLSGTGNLHLTGSVTSSAGGASLRVS